MHSNWLFRYHLRNKICKYQMNVGVIWWKTNKKDTKILKLVVANIHFDALKWWKCGIFHLKVWTNIRRAIYDLIIICCCPIESWRWLKMKARLCTYTLSLLFNLSDVESIIEFLSNNVSRLFDFSLVQMRWIIHSLTI